MTELADQFISASRQSRAIRPYPTEVCGDAEISLVTWGPHVNLRTAFLTASAFALAAACTPAANDPAPATPEAAPIVETTPPPSGPAADTRTRLSTTRQLILPPPLLRPRRRQRPLRRVRRRPSLRLVVGHMRLPAPCATDRPVRARRWASRSPTGLKSP